MKNYNVLMVVCWSMLLTTLSSPVFGQTSFIVNTCNGFQQETRVVSVLIDGALVDFDNCTISNPDLTDFLNCLATEYSVQGTSVVDLIFEQDYPLNGVSSIDLIQILRHILGIQSFSNPCQYYAADVNSDGNMSAIDLVELRKLILGIYSELPQSPTNLFYRADDFQSGTQFKGSEFPLTKVEVVKIHVGDVDL